MINKYKSVEAILRDYNYLKAEIKNLDIEIQEIKSEYVGCGAIGYDEKGGPTNKFSSVIENEIITKEKRINKLEKIKEGKQRIIDKLENALSTLDEREYSIIQLRYFNKKSNRRVAEKLNLTEQRASELKNSIINQLSKLIFIKY